MAEEKPAETVNRNIRQEVISILEEAMRQIMAIPFGPVFESKEEHHEFIQMHWCEQCKRYHRVMEP